MRHAKIAGQEEKKETQDEAKIVSISEVRRKKSCLLALSEGPQRRPTDPASTGPWCLWHVSSVGRSRHAAEGESCDPHDRGTTVELFYEAGPPLLACASLLMYLAFRSDYRRHRQSI